MRDPAFLFYPGDWMTGTMVLNRHQKGCYMDLLIAQFNNGPLSLETIKTVLGNDFAAWGSLSKKFKQDSNGNFANERLVTEIEKRKLFTDSRAENGKKGGRPPGKKPYDKPLGKPSENLPENINEDEDLNEIKDRGVGEGFFLNEIEMKDLTKIEINNVKSFIHAACQKKIIDVDVIRAWEAFRINNSKLHKWYNNDEEVLFHFRHSLKKEINNSNGSNNKTAAKSTAKDAGANELLEELRADWGNEPG